MEQYLRTLLYTVDSSFADEWERMLNPSYEPIDLGKCTETDIRPPGAEDAEADITRDKKRFIAAVRARIFSFLRAWSTGYGASALDVLDNLRDGEGELWTSERLATAWDAYAAGHASLRFDPEARNLRHTYITVDEEPRTWRIEQMLVDPEMDNDWVAEFEVDITSSLEASEPVLFLNRLGSYA